MDNELNIKTIREALSMTQATLAEKVGVDQGTVSTWETGKVKPRGPARKILQAIAKKAAKANPAAFQGTSE